MATSCEITMQSTTILKLVTTFQNACFMGLSFKWLAGFSPLGWPTGENPARRRGFREWSGDRFREREDLGESDDQDHELQIRDDVQQRFLHDGLL